MGFLRETLTPAQRHVSAVVINAGGAGYAVDDILTAVGGTGTAATFRVTSVAAGVIDGIAIETSGDYSVDPTLVANAATGGTGAGATFDLTTGLELGYIMVLKAIEDTLLNSNITAVAVNAGGTGYVVGDEVTISGGTSIFAARARVSAESAGVVTAVEVNSGGAYTVLPGAVGAATTGGTGTGLTLNLTTQTAQWSIGVSDGRSTYFDGITEFELICRGNNAAGDDPIIGLIAISPTNGPQFGLKYFSSFDDAFSFEAQPGASPGTVSNPNANDGPRVCSSLTSQTLYVSYSDRVVNFVIDAAPSFELGIAGLHLPITDAPATTFPYPAMVCGTCESSLITIGTARDVATHSSVVHPMSDASSALVNTPYNFNSQIGALKRIASVPNGTTSHWRTWPGGVLNTSTSLYTNDTVAPIPVGGVVSNYENPRTMSALGGGSNPVLDHDWWNEDDATTGDGQGQTPFPGLSGDGTMTTFASPILIVEDEAGRASLIGQFDRLRAINAVGLNARDRIVDPAGNSYLVFPDTNTGENDLFFALAEF